MKRIRCFPRDLRSQSAWAGVNVNGQRFRCKRGPVVTRPALYRDFDFGHILDRGVAGLERIDHRSRCPGTAQGQLPFPLLARSGGDYNARRFRYTEYFLRIKTR